MSSKLETEIARAIVRAQMASDRGKLISELGGSSRLSRGAKKLGYEVKPEYIVTAIKLIRCNPRGSFNYFVVAAPDQNRYPSVLVYFDIRLPNCERVQVSFHTPRGKADLLEPYINTGRRTHWRKSLCSREACKLLAEYYDL